MIKSNLYEERLEIEAKRAAKKKEQKRLWAQNNREKNRAYGRAFYQRNSERRRANSREYAQAHREERRRYSKEYYQRKKAENPDYVKMLNERSRKHQEGNQYKNYRKKYFEEHKVEIYKKRLSEETYRSIEKVKDQFPQVVEKYFSDYPFEKYGDSVIRGTLYRNHIYKFHGVYDDCYEAGMLAYLYSIHRCAAQGYNHVTHYIRKMVRIYMICALVIYYDARNLCKANNFRVIQLDADSTGRLY